ncbi:MAG: NADH-quinone oxidoreductase subunit NuoG [Desulfobacteraceae bacterium]|nr:MAG: NADH-quinone oxidoreductase subunit NuoG [Desulfobacteraceae bacterium]
MLTIYVNGQAYSIAEGQNLLQACLSLGFDLPYFCWHPALGSVGACRQCAVKQFKDEKDRQGELIMACMTPAADGTRISINDPEAVQFRASVIEWLMINHPHDCPVCDEGGECHLQDMTVMTGHTYRSYRFNKRTYRNQDLGPFIDHEMNRCIQCYRCVRFYRDYAGGRDLHVFASRNRVYFGRFQDGALENEFSGNLVEVCPTGVFTDRTQGDHYTRKWDLQAAPSLCVHCGLGCNTLPGERYGTLRRIRNRYNHQINGYFICDRGRYGYGFVNSDRRIRRPLRRQDDRGGQVAILEKEALQLAATYLAQAKKVIGIGSPRASLESNFALRRLVGAQGFFAGFSSAEQQTLNTALSVLRQGPVASATLQSTGLADCVLVLGEDVTQTAPLLALNLRRLRYRKAAVAASGFQLPEWNDAAVRQLAHLHQPNLFIAATCPTRLDDEAWRAVCATPDDLVRIGFAIWAGLDGDPAPAAELATDLRALAAEAAGALLKARRPLVVTGAACGPALIEAAANIAWRLKSKDRAAELFFCAPECNSMGLAMMDGRDLQEAFQQVAEGSADTVILLENDLYRRADSAAVKAMFQNARAVIVIDHLVNATTAEGDLVLPAATFAEAAGTLVNNEGRAQRHHAVMPPDDRVQPGWRWLQALGQAGGFQPEPAFQSAGDVMAGLAAALPVFQPATELARTADRPAPNNRIARQSHRYSGRTAVTAHIDIFEPKPPEDPDSALAYSMEGQQAPPPAPLVARYWAPGWNSVQALHKFQGEIKGPMGGGDPGRRLIAPGGFDRPVFFASPAAPAPLGENEFRVVPIHHIFGSEELSMASPPVAQRAPEAYLALAPGNPIAGEGARVLIEIQGTPLDLPVRLVAGLPERTAGLPAGLPGLSGLPGRTVAVLPAVLKITKRS